MSSKKKNIFLYLSKVVIITLLIVLFIRTFLFESYAVSSPQMETLLLEGDQILVDKTTYGIRLPITVLSIPFVFDNIFGLQSYSSSVKAPYKRIFESSVNRNDIVLFNNPTEINKPLDKRGLLLSRCIALPGDTINMVNGIFHINDREHINTPDFIEEYSIRMSDTAEIKSIIKELNIPIRNFRQNADTSFLKLSKLEAFLLGESLPGSIIANKIDSATNYQFLVPFRGKVIHIDSKSLQLYKEIILLEQGDKAQIKEDKLFINNRIQNNYFFEEDYYWMLSDNSSNSLDSRTVGFIPFMNIIGKARFVWYSSNNGNIQWDRCFTFIKN